MLQEIWPLFILSQNSTQVPYEQVKPSVQTCGISRIYYETACPRSQQQPGISVGIVAENVDKVSVSVVDYADTMSV